MTQNTSGPVLLGVCVNLICNLQLAEEPGDQQEALPAVRHQQAAAAQGSGLSENKAEGERTEAGPVLAGPVTGSDGVLLFQERQEAEKMFKGKRGAQLAKDISRRMKTYV